VWVSGLAVGLVGLGVVPACLWGAEGLGVNGGRAGEVAVDTGASQKWGARLTLQSVDQGAKEEKGFVSAKPEKQKGSDPSGEGRGGGAPLAIPLVQGYDSFGLTLPDHDLQGRLRSLFVIGAISRIDDRNVELRESFLETYAEDGSPEFSIELAKATLDRFTRVLVSKTPVTLRKAEFELKGASLEFNTTTKGGGLGGPVQMTIYSSTVPAAATQKENGNRPEDKAHEPAPK
jgi:hypothetical protein